MSAMVSSEHPDHYHYSELTMDIKAWDDLTIKEFKAKLNASGWVPFLSGGFFHDQYHPENALLDDIGLILSHRSSTYKIIFHIDLEALNAKSAPQAKTKQDEYREEGVKATASTGARTEKAQSPEPDNYVPEVAERKLPAVGANDLKVGLAMYSSMGNKNIVLKAEGVDFSAVSEIKVPADDYKQYTLAKLLTHFPRDWPSVLPSATVYTDDSQYTISENANLTDKGITVGLGTFSCSLYFQKDFSKPQPKKESDLKKVEPTRPVYKDDVTASLEENFKFPMKIKISGDDNTLSVIACGDLECNRNLHVDYTFSREDWKNNATVREFKSRLVNSGCPLFQPGFYFQNAFHGERTKLYDIGMKFPFPNETDTHFVTFALVEPRVVSLDEHFKRQPSASHVAPTKVVSQPIEKPVVIPSKPVQPSSPAPVTSQVPVRAQSTSTKMHSEPVPEDRSFVMEAKKVPRLEDQRKDLLCPSELKVGLGGDSVDIRVRCEHPDLYLFSEFHHDRKVWSSFKVADLKRLLASKEWPAFQTGCYIDKKFYEEDDSLFDNGIKTFLTNGKPELHELVFVMIQPAPRSTTVSVKPTETKPTPSSAGTGSGNKFCGDCGARNATSDKFCGKCGKRI